MSNITTLDITPTPRILRTLGEIPFATWQCVAELVDNSIDAFLSDKSSIPEELERKITVSWASDSVATKDRVIEVTDNAGGMSVEQLQNAVRAGYSSNDPVGNLGLFGVGFNISTARLGDVTTILSTRSGDADWVGIKIDFQKLIDAKRFDASIIRKPKIDPEEHGTKITISSLKQGILSELPNKENDIRQRLEAVYAPLLNNQNAPITITVKGKPLRPRNHCVWSESRYIRYSDQNVPARITIDRDLGDALFDLSRNCYLTADEAEDYYAKQQEGHTLPMCIIERRKRLTGWLGIQRYADPNDFGIDFIRNGRKILISDKSLFQYENPITGQKELQYPLELGTTVGGRIVGELHVDYLLPTYQKNDFDRSDVSWIQTVDAICGVGPFLPKSRKALGFVPEQTTSPLGLLVNAYRRVDKGTKCLFAPNDVAKRYAAEFRKGQRDYLDDILWWKAAQEEDQKQNTGGSRATTAVNTGDIPSDDVSVYIAGATFSQASPAVDAPEADSQTETTTSVSTSAVSETSKIDELIQRSTSVSQLSGRNYKFGNAGSLNVRAYELNRGSIYYRGEKRPSFFQSDGIDCDFVYDPSHPLLAQYPITAKMLLLQYLSEKLKARDSLPDLVAVYADLIETTMQDARIDRQALQDRASSAFELLREKLTVALKDKASEAVSCIHESAGEVEETITNLIQSANTTLLKNFQANIAAGFDSIEFVPPKTLYRLIERFPEDVFDERVFQTPYMTITLQDAMATQRARDESRDRALSFVKDALRVISGYNQRVQKNELARASLSVDFLLKELS
ncbi:MAG: ATP-binding protein [Oscillospiraceae bacterium]|nr:ATP-binding protein [Oscillospiraceae bacterium]